MSDIEQAKPVTPAPAAPFRIEGDRAMLFGALAKARAEFVKLGTNQTADVSSKEGKKLYDFDYADLCALQDATTPALSKHGLCISQPWWSDGDGYVLLTILMHESGAYMSAETWFGRPDGWQKLGSALSYQQRYQWRSFCGISASKDDDDANSADGNNAKIAPRQGASRAPAPAVKGGVLDVQLHDIRQLAGELNWSEIEGNAFMAKVLGKVKSLDMLSKAEGTTLLAAMVAEQTSRGAA